MTTSAAADDAPPTDTATAHAGRFLTLGQVAETLNVSIAQTYALVRSGDLPSIKIGGRGQWRVERYQLEQFIERMYEQTRQYTQAHPPTSDATHHGRTDRQTPRHDHASRSPACRST